MGDIFLMVGIRIKIQTCILRAGKIVRRLQALAAPPEAKSFIPTTQVE